VTVPVGTNQWPPSAEIAVQLCSIVELNQPCQRRAACSITVVHANADGWPAADVVWLQGVGL
jgi:hypothetical protein